MRAIPQLYHLSGPLRRWVLPLLAAAVILGGTAQLSIAQKTAAQKPAAQGFEAFKLVRTRNIFDPERHPASAKATGPAINPASDYLALTGTLLSKDKALAFFSGSRPSYDKVLPLREKIAGLTITKITPESITVDRAGKALTVPVGWTIPLTGGASALAPAAAPDAPAGGLSAPPAPAAAAPASPNLAAGPNPGGTPPAPPPANDEVARRMRERHLQESK